MAKKTTIINDNGTQREIVVSADNVNYNGNAAGDNAQSAIDGLASRVSVLESSEGGGSGGGSSSDITPNSVMVVYGDSTATDDPIRGEGTISYHTKINIFKYIARLVSPSSYSNNAIHGGILGRTGVTGTVKTKVTSCPTNADYVFILVGINDVNGGLIDIGDVDSAMALSSSDLASDNTFLGMYRYCLETIHSRCTKARIIAVQPLYSHGIDSAASGTKKENLDKVRNGIKELCDRLGGVANRYVCVDTINAGINAGNYSYFYDDSLHPAEAGAELYAHYIYQWGMVRPSDGRIYQDSPDVVCSPKTLSLNASVGSSSTSTVTITTKRTGNITLSVYGNGSSAFSLSKYSITADANGDVETSVAVTFAPSSAGTYSANLKIDYKSAGDWAYIPLSGSAT